MFGRRRRAAMVAETGCHAVMIGRAASANPWIFRQMPIHGHGGYDRPTEADRHRMIRAYFEMLLAEAEKARTCPALLSSGIRPAR